MSNEHIVKSMSALFSSSTLDWRRMCGFLTAHSGFHPAAPVPRKRTRMPDSFEISCVAAAGAGADLFVMQPATAASAVDEARKFLREIVFFMAQV